MDQEPTINHARTPGAVPVKQTACTVDAPVGNDSGVSAEAPGTQTGWFALAGIGLALCLMLNGVFDSVFMSHVDTESFPLRIGESPLSGGLSVIAMCFAIALALWRGRTKPVQLTPVATGVLCALLAIPSALLFMSAEASIPAAVGECAGLALGAVAVFLMALWAETLSRYGRKRSIAALVIALAVDTLIDIVAAQALVDAAIMGLVLIAAVASPCMLYALEYRAHFSAITPNGNGETTTSAGKNVALAQIRTGGIPLWVSIVCIAIYGFMMGRIQSMGHEFGAAGALAFVANNVVSIGALVVALLTYGLMHLRNPHGVTRLFILAFLVAALYLSGIFGTALEPAGMVMMTIARFAIFVYIWLLTCDGASVPGRPMATFALGWGSFTLLNTVSTKLGMFVFADGAGFVAYTLLIIGCVVGLIVVEFMPHRRGGAVGQEAAILSSANAPAGEGAIVSNGAAGDGVATADASAVGPLTAESLLAARCQKLAEHYGLTARELEVLVPLVRGRSAASIATSLNVSTETARTHIRHIYQKTDIHSREELMDAIEAAGD